MKVSNTGKFFNYPCILSHGKNSNSPGSQTQFEYHYSCIKWVSNVLSQRDLSTWSSFSMELIVPFYSCNFLFIYFHDHTLLHVFTWKQLYSKLRMKTADQNSLKRSASCTLTSLIPSRMRKKETSVTIMVLKFLSCPHRSSFFRNWNTKLSVAWNHPNSTKLKEKT